MNCRICAAFLAAVAAAVAAAVPAYSRGEFPLLSDTLSVDRVIVSTLKAGHNISESASSIEVSTSFDIKEGSSFTVSDVLKDKPGISKGGDGIWATNINVRGHNENRLVTLIDRNRVVTATDLTVSLSMLDVDDIDHIEVISGAQSSIYGSGAMGGIVNVVTKDGHFANSPYFNGCFTTSFSSVNTGVKEYLSLYGGGRKWYVKANGSFSRAGDIRTPEGFLNNSGYKSSNAGLTAAFKPNENQLLKAQFQTNHSWDAGIPGGAAFSPQASASYKNADRTMASLSYVISDLSTQFQKLSFKLWYQGVMCDVEMLPNMAAPLSGALPTRITPYATHRTFGANAEAECRTADWNTLTLGAEIWQRRISSDRNKYIDQYSDGIIVAQMIRNEIPLPDASYTSTGIFAQDEMRFLEDRLILSVGGRFDVNAVRNSECHNVEYVQDVASGAINGNPPGKYVTFSAGGRTDVSWSANAGILYKADRNLDLVANINKAYRSPALEELFKFIDLAGNKIHFGNPSLKPEKGLGADIGARYHGEKFNARVSIYSSYIRDMIVERKANTDVSSSIDTLVLDNTGKALLYGFSADLSYNFSKEFKVYASGSWTIGREIASQWAWLPMIPPLTARAGLSYNNSKALGADLCVTIAGARKENEIAQGERATDAWYRLDFSVHSKAFCFGRCDLQLFAGIDNLTNVSYVNFLATNRGNIICEPGRNFYARACLNF